MVGKHGFLQMAVTDMGMVESFLIKIANYVFSTITISVTAICKNPCFPTIT